MDALATHIADSRLIDTFSKAGDYAVRIRDVRDEGGEEYAYRLKIVAARPDYVLRINTDSCALVPGDSALAGGHRAAERRFRRRNQAGRARPAAGTGRRRCGDPGRAAGDPVDGHGVGRRRAGLWLFRPSWARPRWTASRWVRKAVPVETVVQAFYIKHWVPTKGCVLQVKEPAFYTISANLPPKQVLEVKQGGKVEVVVKAARRAEGKFPVNLALLPPTVLVPPPQDAPRPGPPPLTVAAASIPADKDEATVTITAAAKAPFGAQQTIILRGTMNAGKETVTRLLPAITARVVAAK